MACHPHAILTQTSSKAAPHLVLELDLDAWKLPSPSPSLLALPLARKRRVVGLLFDYPMVVIPGSRQEHLPYDEGPRKAQGGRRAAQDSRR